MDQLNCKKWKYTSFYSAFQVFPGELRNNSSTIISPAQIQFMNNSLKYSSKDEGLVCSGFVKNHEFRKDQFQFFT